jgi:HK97 family phage major capsid protein
VVVISYEIKKLVDELLTTWESELKPRIDGNQRSTAEAKQAIDRVQDRLDQLEVNYQKRSLATGRSIADHSSETKQFISWCRKGVLPAESKVLALRDETLGGVLAPPDYIAEVVKGVVQFSPIRSIATVKPTTRTSVQYPKRTGNFAAVWTAETATRNETTGRLYGLDEIPTHEAYARVIISNWDLEDSVVDLESDIRNAMAEQFGVSEGAAFVSGTGVGKPEGFLTNSDVIASPVLNGGAAFTNADAVIKLPFSVKEQYWPNGRYVLNRQTLRDLRVLKDTAGNYLWQPSADGVHGVSSGLPTTLNGYPYSIATDMPTAASNALTVAFGDFQRSYWIADRIEMAVLRDPFSNASAGAVVFHARKRVGGQVVLPEAINVLKMA